MKDIRDSTNAAIKIASEVKHQFGEAINWGDLHCVDVERFEDMAGNSGYRVLIEEASPECPEFQMFIHKQLQNMGYPDIDVRTEW